MSVIEEYLIANSKYEFAKREISTIAQQLLDVSTKLKKDPIGVMFANSSVPMPMSVALNRKRESLDANQWPTADKINEAVGRLATTKEAVVAAWHAVPADLRKGLVPPSDPNDPMMLRERG